MAVHGRSARRGQAAASGGPRCYAAQTLEVMTFFKLLVAPPLRSPPLRSRRRVRRQQERAVAGGARAGGAVAGGAATGGAAAGGAAAGGVAAGAALLLRTNFESDDFSFQRNFQVHRQCARRCHARAAMSAVLTHVHRCRAAPSTIAVLPLRSPPPRACHRRPAAALAMTKSCSRRHTRTATLAPTCPPLSCRPVRSRHAASASRIVRAASEHVEKRERQRDDGEGSAFVPRL